MVIIRMLIKIQYKSLIVEPQGTEIRFHYKSFFYYEHIVCTEKIG